MDLQSSYLDSLEIYATDPFALALSKSFSRIRNLRFKRLFALKSEWDIILLASQTLTTLDLTSHSECKFRLDIASQLWYTHDKILPDEARVLYDWLKDFPFDLGRLPALRHLKIQLQILPEHNFLMFSFLNSLLSIDSSSSSPSGIETLDLEIIWHSLDSEDEITDLFASGGEWRWDTLDNVLTSEMFPCLREVVLDFGLKVHDWDHNSGYDNLALSYVNDLFPMLRRGDRTLETHVKIQRRLQI